MFNPLRIWQLASLILACALIAAITQLLRNTTQAEPVNKVMLPTVINTVGYEHLALSPKARHAQERYSL